MPIGSAGQVAQGGFVIIAWRRSFGAPQRTWSAEREARAGEVGEIHNKIRAAVEQLNGGSCLRSNQKTPPGGEPERSRSA